MCSTGWAGDAPFVAGPERRSALARFTQAQRTVLQNSTNCSEPLIACTITSFTSSSSLPVRRKGLSVFAARLVSLSPSLTRRSSTSPPPRMSARWLPAAAGLAGTWASAASRSPSILCRSLGSCAPSLPNSAAGSSSLSLWSGPRGAGIHVGRRSPNPNRPQAPRGSGAGAGPAPRSPTPSSASSSPSSSSGSGMRPLANEEIRVPEVRVVEAAAAGATPAHVGVMKTAEAIALAKSKGLDLVLFAPTAVPPVCRIVSLEALTKERAAAAASQAGDASSSSSSSNDAAPRDREKEKERDRKPKAMRLTARTDDHDLSIKGARVVEFLRSGHGVAVNVSFTLSAWIKEEPARREVLAKVVKQVLESGAGFCDANSIRGEGAVLSAYFSPVSTPRPKSEWERVLKKLAAPLAAPNEKDPRMVNVKATAAAALGGTAKASTIEEILPPAEELARLRSAKLHRGLKPGEPADAEDEVDVKREGQGLPDVGVTPPAPRRKRLAKKRAD
jgi:translation initiation factor IF-3